MNDQQLLRYSRHILLDEIGIEGQDSATPKSKLALFFTAVRLPVECHIIAV